MKRWKMLVPVIVWLAIFATGPAPIYFSSGYIGRGDFWKFGLIFGVVFFAGLLLIVYPWLRTIG